MFEMMMLLGFVYAGCCYLLPDRRHMSRTGSRCAVEKGTAAGSKRRDSSTAKDMHRRRLAVATVANGCKRAIPAPVSGYRKLI